MGKYTKARKGRRVPRHYKPTGPNQFVLKEYQSHTNSMGIPDDGKRNRKDYHELPATKGITEPRLDVVGTLHQLWQNEAGSGRGQGVNSFFCEIVLNGMFRQVRMYFSADVHFFVEVETCNGLAKSWKRSITYRDRQTALRQWGYGKVTWVEEQQAQTEHT